MKKLATASRAISASSFFLKNREQFLLAPKTYFHNPNVVSSDFSVSA